MAEPEWDAETRELALAYAEVDLCPVCHGPAFLCQDPELQDDWDVPPPTRCHRKTAIREKQKGMTEQTNPHLDALIWRTVLRGAEG